MNRTQEIGVVVNTVAAMLGHTQRDVARIVGSDPATISRRTKRGVGSWSAEDLEKLADEWEVPVSTFYRQPDDLREAVIARYLQAA
jgi:transcriptional regulator with XRE-family HTH domain